MVEGPSVVVVGEALVDLIVDETGHRHAYPGGSPANVALGLGRLGTAVSLLTDLGDDAFGGLAREHLRESGVNLLSPPRPGGRTSTASARLATDGSATYNFELSWTVDLTVVPQMKTVLHTGSLGAMLGGDALAALLTHHRGHGWISYDPNVRPDAMGTREVVVERVEALVGLSDLVKVSDEDLGWLYPGTQPAEAARRWSECGPRAVIMTRGSAGVSGFAGELSLDVAPFAADVVDTVGAGDSFMAALLYGLLAGGTRTADEIAGLGSEAWAAVLTFASAAAAVTVSRSGADLPSLAEVEGVLTA